MEAISIIIWEGFQTWLFHLNMQVLAHRVQNISFLYHLKAENQFQHLVHSIFPMSLYWEHLVLTLSSVSGSLRSQNWQFLCSEVKM